MNSQLSLSVTTLHVLFSSCIWICLINIPPCQGNSIHANCSESINCGNLNVSYPCGYDQLDLTCENGVARIIIANISYRLLAHYPDTQVIQIARDDYANGICPHSYHNTTLDSTLFELASGYINFSLIYGCPANFKSIPGHFTCHVNGISNSEGYVMVGALGPMACSASVVVPAPQDLLRSPGNLSSSIENNLKQGFKVRLKVNNVEAPQGQSTNGHRKWLTISTVGAATLLGIIIFMILIIWFRKSCKSSGYMDNNINVEVVINTDGFLAPRRYKYYELKKITNSFTETIGEGGYGTVYKGKLPDGRLVAVKLLIKSKGNGEEFINEVASISKTAHVNIVSLLGYCYESKSRALIYEFMSNSSLDKLVPVEGALHTSSKIDWKILHRIALGIARGLEYLHQGCKSRILHLDIKPQNILLDEDFVPKISDFGLAKLCKGKESIVSLLGIRGTIGYIAPEVLSRNFGRVSHKSDVYSYGMSVLAMVCGRSNDNHQVSRSSDLYFPHCIYKQLEPNREFKFQGIVTVEEEELARKLILVSFWCIQTNPSDRPSISKVIDMLEGSIHPVDMPPEPFLFDPMTQHRTLAMASPPSSSHRDGENEESSLKADGEIMTIGDL